jgi:hypothetical protein
MSSRRDTKEELRRVLAHPIRTPIEARQAEEAARMLRDILEAEQRADRLLAKEEAAEYVVGAKLEGLTLHEAARRVLQRAGRPLHAKEIGVRMKAAGWRHPRATNPRSDQIEHSLAAQLPKYPTFKRVKPQTFALAEWEETKEAPRPLIGIFDGPGGPVGRGISDAEKAAGVSAWRSS